MQRDPLERRHAREDSSVGTATAPSASCAWPVVIRRTIARSENGHGGGWSLAGPVDKVSLLDVYEALGEPTILAMQNRTESPGCAVEKAVNRALGGAFEAAEASFLEELRGVTLASRSRARSAPFTGKGARMHDVIIIGGSYAGLSAAMPSFAALFLLSHQRVAGSIASDLGLEIEEIPHGKIIRTDPMTKETSVKRSRSFEVSSVPVTPVEVGNELWKLDVPILRRIFRRGLDVDVVDALSRRQLAVPPGKPPISKNRSSRKA